MPSHPSFFFFEGTGLLLVVYVDDLLRAGPTQHYANFWRTLRAQVDIEEPEDLDRYLGRHHTFEECSRLSEGCILLEIFQSPVDIFNDLYIFG